MTTSKEGTPSREGPKRRRRWLRWLAIPAFLLFALALAPTIVTYTPLKDALLSAALKEHQGSITAEGLSIGWFRPLTATRLELHDAEQKPLMQVASLTLSRSLLALLWDPRDLGIITIEQPRGNIDFKGGTSNIEEFLNGFAAEPSAEGSSPGFVLDVADGQFLIRDEDSQRQWQLDSVNIHLEQGRTANGSLALQLDGRLADPQGSVGKLAGSMTWQLDGRSGIGSGTIDLDIHDVLLEAIQPVLRRWLPSVDASGVATGNVHLVRQDDHQSIVVQDVSVEDLAVVAPEVLGPDVLHVASCRLDGQVGMSQDGSWTVDDLAFDSDLGRVSASLSGILPPAADTNRFGMVVEWLQTVDGRVAAEADLARIAATLPRTMRIRAGTRLVSGRVSLDLTAGAKDQDRLWAADLRLADLAAEQQGNMLRLNLPVQLTTTVLRRGDRWEVERASIQTPSINVIAAGTTTEGTARVTAELEPVVRELSQFVDLSDFTLAGDVDGHIRWGRESADGLVLDASLRAKDFLWAPAGKPPWHEQQLDAQCTVQTSSDRFAWNDWHRLNATIQAGDDRAELHARRVATDGSVRQWRISTNVVGAVERWTARLRPWLPLDDWRTSGQTVIEAECLVSSDQTTEFDRLSVTADNLVVQQGGATFSDPRVTLSAGGRWESPSRRLIVPSATIAGTTLAVKVTDLEMPTIDFPRGLRGAAAFRAKLESLQEWFGSAESRAHHQLQGEATGTVQVRGDESRLVISANTQAKEFRYQQRSPENGAPWYTVWHEPLLQANAQGEYLIDDDRLVVEPLSVGAHAVLLRGRAQVDQIGSRASLRYQGQWEYDLARLTGQLPDPWPGFVQLQGQGRRPISFHGPLVAPSSSPVEREESEPIRQVAAVAEPVVDRWLSEFGGAAGFDWQSGNVAGFRLGTGELDAQLAEGLLTIKPVKLAVNGGTLQLAPRVRLAENPMVLEHDAGLVIDQVELTPEMCRGWLQYVAPLVANATAAKGKFSVTLGPTRVLLSQPQMSDISGRMQVHSAQIGPGPLTYQLLDLARQIAAMARGQLPQEGGTNWNQWLELPPQQIVFRMARGRVYHDRLQLVAGDVVIQTRGSVGLDQSLDLVAEVPIRDEWVQQSRFLAGLRGQVLQLPITGTLTQPRVDRRVLGDLIQQGAAGAASQMLERELQRGLQQLFPNR